jgi:hypothetical protein
MPAISMPIYRHMQHRRQVPGLKMATDIRERFVLILGSILASRACSSRKGQTALEYMLMIAVIFSILALVVAMTGYVSQVGAGLGGTIDTTRAQVIDWIFT